MHESGGNPNPSCYIRIPFSIKKADLSQYNFLLLNLRYDDGFIAYLNGTKVAEANAPNPPLWNSFATGDNEAGTAVQFDISGYIGVLVDGKNLLAIQGLNANNQSSDFLITAELLASDNLYGDFTSSKLPIVFFNTNGQSIPNEPKIDAEMKVIYNGLEKINHPGDAAEYDGKIGIEIGGRFSASFPQQPYGIETRDDAGNNLNVSLIGMPPENDWQIISNYNEKSLVRTILAFDLFREMGHYAPRAKLCEVFVNSSYRGIYVFSEKIKRDKNRVDIAELRPVENAGDSLTGGYIVKIDYYNSSNSWRSNYTPLGHPEQRVYFVYYYPKPDEITNEQKSYIQSFIDATEGALYGNRFDDPLLGYRNYMDVSSFIDYFILSEVSRNVDGYKKSRYFYKDKDSKGGLLYAGPVWDFDWAWKNIGESIFSATDGSGWSYKTNDYNPDIFPPGWYRRLLQDGYFTNKLIARYQELRTNILDLNTIYAYIDSVRAYVDEAQERHFALWPIERDYRAPEVDAPSRSYDEEIVKLKEWIRRRIVWLDANIPKLRAQIVTQASEETQQAKNPSIYRVFPNPAKDYVFVESEIPIRQIKIYNLLGQQVYESEFNNSYSTKVHIDHLQSGLYFIHLILRNGASIVHRHVFYN
jgi:hypothetical protein